MKLNKEILIRINLIIIGILILIYGFFLIFNQINPLLNGFVNQNLNFENLQTIDINSFIIILIIGYIIFFIGRNWKNSFKELSKIFISIAIIFLTFTIIFFTINNNSNEIVNSIQPSLDSIIVNSIEIPINKLIENNEGKNIDLILSENSKIQKMYSKNLTFYDSNIITKSLEITNLNSNEKLIFSKFFISSTYNQIKKNKPKLIDMPIPISSIKKESLKQGVDLNIFNQIDISLLENFPINQKAYLNILILENETKKTIKINNITNLDINIIWNNLGFNSNISNSTKNKIINVLLSVFLSQMQNSTFKNIAIPITSIGSILPEDIKSIFKYDILSNNISIRINSLNEIRNDCKIEENKSSYLIQVCDYIKLSEYNYLMKNIINLTYQNNLSLSNSTINSIKEYDSLLKVKEKINTKTNSYLLYGFLFILFISFSIGSYFLHFRINKEKFPKFHIPYFISKINFYRTIPMFFLTYILYYIMSENIILNLIKKNISSQITDAINLIINLPIYNLLIKIIYLIFIYNLFYFIISLLLFILFYFLLKKEISENNF